MMSPFAIIFAVLMVFASLPSTLTFVRLWQIKEWRLDRLREHLRENGWFLQLFGRVRPLVTLVLLLLSSGGFREVIDVNWGFFLLAGLGVVQLLTMHHRPVWTSKAKAIFALSAALIVLISLTELDIVLHFAPSFVRAFLLLPLFAPAFVFVSWLILYPLDAWLKNRVLQRAMTSRAAHPNLTVIGITGSVGKTTTKELLLHLLKDKGAIATPLHVNTEMGVAAWITKVLTSELSDSKKILIVEMGAYRSGEISLLCDIAKPTIGAMTFVGRQHSGLFGGEQAIARAKGELLAALPSTGQAFINADSPLTNIILEKATSAVTTAGTDHHANIRALDIEETGSGIRFRAFDTTFDVPLAGTHTVTNILLAIATAQNIGMDLREIAKKLETFRAFEHTFSRREEAGITILDNTYNASVESFLAAIEWARNQPHREKVLLCDGIIELGDDEERLHRDIAKKACSVFQRAFILHQRFLPYFRDAFGDRIDLAIHSVRLREGALLVCMGRMSETTIRNFLPKKNSTSN